MKKILFLILCIFIIGLLQYDFNISDSIIYNSLFCVAIIYFLFDIGSKIKFKEMKFNIWIFIVSLFNAIFMQIGINYEKGGTLYYLDSVWKVLLAIATVALFTGFFYLIMYFLFEWLDELKKKKDKKEKKRESNKFSKIVDYIVEHPFKVTFILTLLMSIIQIVFFYPGNLTIDGVWQLDCYYGALLFNNHHPASLTYVLGWFMDIGRHFGNDNLGIFLFICIQMLLNAFVYAYTIKIMTKMKIHKVIIISSILFYSCFPFLVNNSITYVKDVSHYLFFLLLFVYVYYHFIFNYEEKNKIKYFVVALIYLGIYLTRNTGFYIISIFSLAMLIFNFKKDKIFRIGFLILSLYSFGVHVLYHDVFLVKLKIPEARISEMMSIPMQHLGRYFKDYADELTDLEHLYVKELFRGTSAYTLGERYHPFISDGVKDKFIPEPTEMQWEKFTKLYFNCFKRHPSVYFDATFNNIYGYFYPNKLNYMNEEIGFYGVDKLREFNMMDFKFKNNNLKWGRDFLYNLSRKLSEAPLACLLYAPAFYTYILLGSFAYFMSRKSYKELAYLVLLFLVLGFCIVSPVNGHLRYLQPVMVSTPFLIAIMYYVSGEEAVKNKLEKKIKKASNTSNKNKEKIA